QTTLLAQKAERPNLIARLEGQGNAAPLLLYGHVDVITTDRQNWQHPPFEGKRVDGFIWGRGALDMKGGQLFDNSALFGGQEYWIEYSSK
ncbi:MAG: M20/M25/M40 family metallo-hydrolase, partial [Clostridia bacterium]